MTRRINFVAVMAAVALAGGLSCTTKQGAPQLSGPSELSTSITISANPDSLTQDGAAQAQITVLVRGSASQPIANLPVRLSTAANGVVADFGQLAARQVVTGSDGRATVTYTAPDPARSAADVLSAVTILATPAGTDASAAIARSITISLTQPGIVVPPSAPPVAKFTFSPVDPVGDQQVFFDASTSTSASPIASYSWNFGDGTTGTGVRPAHSFSGCRSNGTIPQTFVVGLTVTDTSGQSASAPSQNVTITNCR